MGEILPIVLTLFSIAIGNAALVMWFRSESRSDWRHLDARLESHLHAIHQEMKDFHGRLIAIEERRNSG